MISDNKVAVNLKALKGALIITLFVASLSQYFGLRAVFSQNTHTKTAVRYLPNCSEGSETCSNINTQTFFSRPG